jgi:catechol 2,3-dioxygenase-like lactoylglutathione lyase family enzyme
MAEAINYDGGLTVSMPVSDLDKAIDWYQEVLGFELQYRMDDIGWCEVVSPVANVNVGLSVVEKPNPGGATPTFGVKDIDAARASLEANNVRIDGDAVTIENLVSLVTFYDIDDNALMFYQMLTDDA